MRRATGLVLVSAALIAGAMFFLRSRAKVAPPRRPSSSISVEDSIPEVLPPTLPPPPTRPPPPTPVDAPPPSVLSPKPCFAGGTVRLAAPPPRQKPIRMDGDARCASLHDEPLLAERIVVDSNLGLRWAFVYLLEGAPPAEPSFAPVLLTQKGCRFEPHVLGIQTDQPLRVRNSDPLLHSVQGFPFRNRGFTFGQTEGAPDRRVVFQQEEVVVKISCNVHPWMTAWVGVLHHPYFSVTDASGAYAFPELPAGRYVLGVWHEAYKSVSRAIDLEPGDVATVDFLLDDRK